jgi:hypothetical protein
VEHQPEDHHDRAELIERVIAPVLVQLAQWFLPAVVSRGNVCGHVQRRANLDRGTQVERVQPGGTARIKPVWRVRGLYGAASDAVNR